MVQGAVKTVLCALRRAKVAATGVVVCGVLLTGCAGGTMEPGPSPTATAESPEPSPTATLTPTAIDEPVPPPEMERSDEAGAIAAATYFMDLYAYVLATGDLTEWTRVSAQSCGFCANVRADMVSVYESGGSFAEWALTFGPAEYAAYEPSIQAHAIRFAFASTGATQLDPNGAVVAEVPPEEGFLLLDVIHGASGWLLVTGGAHESVDG